MELFDRISSIIELKKQNREFDKLCPDIMFTRFYLLYEEKKDNEEPDTELVKAAYNCALGIYEGKRSELYNIIRNNIQKEYGYSQRLIKHYYYGTIDNNNTVLEKMKKYIYSNMPVMTYEDKLELVCKVVDIYQIGLSKDYKEDEKISSFWDGIFKFNKTETSAPDTESEEQ